MISVPDGPLRLRFAAHGQVVDGTASLPLWGDSAYRWTGRCARTAVQTFRLARTIRRTRSSAVLTNSSVSSAPVLAGRLARVPVVVHVRDVPASRLAPFVFRLHAALAHTVIIITDGLAPYFERGRARVIRIPDGIEMPAAIEARDAKTAFHTPLRLSLIGGISARKGQDIAVQALARLCADGVDATLDLIGREIEARFTLELRQDTARLGVADRVRFVGELDDVSQALLDTDIVIAPSRGEWTPLVLMEALAHQRPVVAANVGGVGDVISHRDTGLLIPPEDADRLAEAIAELAADPAAAAQMASRGRRRVDERFNLERMVRAVEAELQPVLDASVERFDPKPAAHGTSA